MHLDYGYLRKKSAFNHSRWPFSQARKPVRYGKGLCPVAEAVFDSCFLFPLHQWLSDDEIDDTIRAVAKVAGHYRERKQAEGRAMRR